MNSIFRGFLKRILPVMLTVILMLGTAVALAPAKAVYVGDEIEIEIDLDKYYDDDGTGKYYGRTALSGLSNSTALLYAYDKIVEGVTNSAEQISVYNGKDSLSSDEFATVFGAYLHDHPEHFWINNAYSVKINTATVISMTPHYTMSGDNLTAAKEAFKNAATELLQGITTSMSEYERELLIHDRIAEKVVYEAADNAHNAYGALVEGKAVCEGYAKAFQYLLQLTGIQAFMITGTSTNPMTGAEEGHAWTAVRIDDKYYHVDPTWDDQDDLLFHAYFNKTTAAISEDHTIATAAYPLPSCTSEEADYFTVSGGKMETFDTDRITDLIKSSGGTACVYITGDVKAFINAFNANVSSIASNLGFTNFGCHYVGIGREYRFGVAEAVSGYTVSGTVTCFGNEADLLKAEIIKEGETVPAHFVELTGSKNEKGEIVLAYSFDAIPDGTYTLRVSKPDHITREYTVTVNGGNAQQDAKIHLKGDVNGDGRINISDVSKASLHVKCKKLLADYEFACADINGDGRVNISDTSRINLYAKGKISRW